MSHTSCGSIDCCFSTSGSASDRQRPSAPATDVQVFGMNLPPVTRNTSGTHSWVGSVHGPRRAAAVGSTALMIDEARQCASGAHEVSVDGSITAGQPDSYTHVFGSSQAAGGGWFEPPLPAASGVMV